VIAQEDVPGACTWQKKLHYRTFCLICMIQVMPGPSVEEFGHCHVTEFWMRVSSL